MCWQTLPLLLVAPAEMGAKAVYGSTCACQRGWQCQPATVAPVSLNCRGTDEAHSCTGTFLGNDFLEPWATLLQKRVLERVWLLVLPSMASLHGHPSRMGSHTSPTGRQQPSSFGIALWANKENHSAITCLCIPVPAFLQHVRTATGTRSWCGAEAAISPIHTHHGYFEAVTQNQVPVHTLMGDTCMCCVAL